MTTELSAMPSSTKGSVDAVDAEHEAHRHHAHKAQRHEPQRPAAEHEGEDADGHHGEDVVDAADRMHEAMDEAMRRRRAPVWAKAAVGRAISERREAKSARA